MTHDRPHRSPVKLGVHPWGTVGGHVLNVMDLGDQLSRYSFSWSRADIGRSFQS